MFEMDKDIVLEQLKNQKYNAEDLLIENDVLECLIEMVEDSKNWVKPLCMINDRVFFYRFLGNGMVVDYDFVTSVSIIDGKTFVKTGWHNTYVQLNDVVFLNEVDAKHRLSRLGVDEI